MALILKWILSREEGVLTLWRGATPTIARAIVVNAAQLGTYSQAKESAKKMMNMSEGIPLHFTAAMISGLVTTIASMPVDIVKTRLQNQKVPGSNPTDRDFLYDLRLLMEFQNIKVSSMSLVELSKTKVSFHCGKDSCHTISVLDHTPSLLSSWWNSLKMHILDEIQNLKHELPLKNSIILPNKLYIPSKFSVLH